MRAYVDVRRSGAPSQVTLGLNGWATEQVEIDVVRDPTGRRAVRVDELDLLHGERTRLLPLGPRTVEVDEWNYAPVRGVRGGRGAIALETKGFGRHPLVIGARLLPGAGVYVSAIGPPALHVRVPRAVWIPAGDTRIVNATITDSGLPVSNASLSLAAPAPVGTVAGAGRRRIAYLARNRPASVRVRVIGRAEGVGSLGVGVSGVLSRADGATRIVVFGFSHSAAALCIVIVLLLTPSLALAVSGLALVRQTRRTSTTARDHGDAESER